MTWGMYLFGALAAAVVVNGAMSSCSAGFVEAQGLRLRRSLGGSLLVPWDHIVPPVLFWEDPFQRLVIRRRGILAFPIRYQLRVRNSEAGFLAALAEHIELKPVRKATDGFQGDPVLKKATIFVVVAIVLVGCALLIMWKLTE